MTPPTDTAPTLKQQRNEWIETNPLRKWRTSKSVGLSMHDVASTLGVAPTTVQLWEYGTNAPAGDNVDRLVALTGDETLPARWTRWLSRRPS